MKVKLLAPNVALVHARMTCQCAPENETPTQPRTTIVSFVAHQLGERWLCAAAHNTGLSSEHITRA